MDKITIEYKGSVHTPAGFRGVDMLAIAEKISDKRAKVIELIAIDGEEIKANMSRTGANRQKFYGYGVARHEEGKIKNLSSYKIKESIS